MGAQERPSVTGMYENCEFTFSVFTATFNRANLLRRCFDSLVRQSYQDLEWIVVDDGSTDGTEAVIADLAPNAPFPIRYLKQRNSGKHVAINRAVDVARGFFFAVLDSDDQFHPEALERFRRHWEAIPMANRDEFTGTVGLDQFPSGEVVGERFPEDELDVTSLDLVLNGWGKGDKNGVIRVSVMREFPFPFEEFKFVPEAIVWNRMAQRYKSRFFNEVVVTVEYRAEGLSSQGPSLSVRNAPVFRAYHGEFASLKVRMPWWMRLRAQANYVRFSFHEGRGLSATIRESGAIARTVACLPLGAGLFLRDYARGAARR